MNLIFSRVISKGGSVGSSSRRQSEAVPKDSSPEPDFESDDNDDDLDEEQKAEKKAKRLEREVKHLSNKLVRLKEKQEASKRERQNIRDTMKKNQVTLKWVELTMIRIISRLFHFN